MLMRAYGTDAMAAAAIADAAIGRVALFLPSEHLVELPDLRTADDFAARGITAADHAWPMQEGSTATYAFDTIGAMDLLQDTETSGDKPQGGRPATGLWFNGTLIDRTGWETRHLKDQLNSGDTATFELDQAFSIFLRFKFAEPQGSAVSIAGNRSATGTNPGWSLRVSLGDLYIVVDDSVAGVQSSALSASGFGFDDTAWHEVLLCYDGAGNFHIVSDQGTLASTAFTVSGATGAQSFVIGGAHAESTAVNLMFSGAYAWEQDVRADAATIYAALSGLHRSMDSIGVTGESRLTPTVLGGHSYHAGGQYICTYADKQTAIFLDPSATAADGEVYGVPAGGAVTNLATYSEQFLGVWTPVGTGYTEEDQTHIAPNGHRIASRFIQGLSTDYYQSPNATVTASTDYCQSIWLKGDTEHNVVLSFRNGAGTEMSNKTVAVTTEWQRFFITDQSTDTGASLRITPTDSGTSYEVYLFGWQVQAGTVPTLYVQTIGSIAGVSSTSYRYNHTAGAVDSQRGSVIAEVTLFEDDYASTRRLLVLDDGNVSFANQLVMATASGQQGFYVQLYDSSEVEIAKQDPTGGSLLSQPTLVVASWDAVNDLPQTAPNNFAIRNDDGTTDDRVSNDNAAGTVTQLNSRVSIGGPQNSSSDMRGLIRKLEIFSAPLDLGGN